MQTPQKSSMKTATNSVSRQGDAGIRRRLPTYNTAPRQTEPEATQSEGLSGSAKVFLALSTVLVVISLGLFGSAKYFGDSLSRAGHSNSTEALEVVIANNVLNINENAIRFPNQRKSGVHNRIELYLHWPTMSGYRDELSDVFNNSGNMEELVFVSIEPRTMSFDMSGRLEPIYSLYFNGLAVHERSGLVRQPLSEAGGFLDEDLYYEPDSPYPYTVRCVRDFSEIGTPMCMRDIHIGKDLMVTYRYNKRFLNEWSQLDEAVRSYTQSLLSKDALALVRQ